MVACGTQRAHPGRHAVGPALGSLLGGAVIIEQVFSWPGLDGACLSAFQPLLMGFVVVGGVLYVMGVLLSDLLYAWLDPRIQFR